MVFIGRTRRPAPVGVRRRLKTFSTADRKGSFYPEKHVSGTGLICAAAMGGGNHGHDPGRLVDLAEKTPGADTIPPYVRVWPFQSFDIRTCCRVRTQLRIDILVKLTHQLGHPGSSKLVQVLLKLIGFKNPEISQRTGPCPAWIRERPSAFVSAGFHSPESRTFQRHR